MNIKFLDIFCRSLVFPILLLAPFELKAEKLDSTFWFSYGFGAGISGTLCDQVDAGLITNLEAKMFTSNFEESMEDPKTAEAYNLEALARGFNEIVPQFENCKIKFN
tara:strand:- start:201 stop:521 length:321 start_codon:yes stop_codon:yes gene_type:complete